MLANTDSSGLPARPLGVCGIELSRVGLDARPLTRAGAGSDPITSLSRAAELGVNWIDTCGDPATEELVGRAVSTLPADERPRVMSVCRPATNETIGRDGAAVEQWVTASLRRLRVASIDVFLLDAAGDGAWLEAAWEAMQRLADAGRIGVVGLRDASVDALERCSAVFPISCLQVPIFLDDRETASAQLPWCLEHDVPVIARTGDAPPRLTSALGEAGERHGNTARTVGLAWVLAWPGLVAALVEDADWELIDEWADAARLKLTGDDLDRIAAAIDELEAQGGPERPPVLG